MVYVLELLIAQYKEGQRYTFAVAFNTYDNILQHETQIYITSWFPVDPLVYFMQMCDGSDQFIPSKKISSIDVSRSTQNKNQS